MARTNQRKGKRPLISITVVLSEAEYLRLKHYKAMTPDGTMNNVCRSQLGLQPRAQGQLQPDAVILREGEYLDQIGAYQ